MPLQFDANLLACLGFDQFEAPATLITQRQPASVPGNTVGLSWQWDPLTVGGSLPVPDCAAVAQLGEEALAGWQELHGKDLVVLEPSGRRMLRRTCQQMSRAGLEDQNVREPNVAGEETSIGRKLHAERLRHRPIRRMEKRAG